jgi:hypothetical protein
MLGGKTGAFESGVASHGPSAVSHLEHSPRQCNRLPGTEVIRHERVSTDNVPSHMDGTLGGPLRN